jgi:carbon storage regulator
MLVLSRYRDESIHIGDNIVITIVDVRGDRVRLGIQAPSDIPVHRQEIYETIARGKQELPKDELSEQTASSKKNQKYAAPLEKQIKSRKNKGLPVDIDIHFGSGIVDIITQ